MSTARSGTFASAEFASQEGAFGLTDLVRLVQKRGRTILQTATAFVVLVTIILLVWPSQYSSTAVVMLDPRKNNVTDRSQVLADLPTDPASVQNQIQILTSRDLAAAVVDRLQLTHDPEFNGALAPFPLNLLAQTPQRSAVIDAFLRHLSVESEGLSTAIAVTFSGERADEAARIVNALVDAYIGAQIAQKSQAQQRTTRWLDSRIAELARQVQSSDDSIQSYKAANGLNDSGQGTQSLIDQQLGAINTQLVQARADLAQKQAMYAHVEQLVKSGHASEVSQVVASPLIIQLRQQQAEAIRNQADIDTRYGPKHPKRLAAESQLRDLESKIGQEAERIAGSVGNDAAVGQAQVQSLENSLASVRAQSNAQNLARVKLRALEASAASTRSMYESFVTRLREAQDQSDVTTPDAVIISHAAVPTRPSSPRRALIFWASIPAGLLLGLLWALVMERTSGIWTGSGTAVSTRPTRRIPIPVVALVPDARAPGAAHQVAATPSAPFSRALIGVADRLASHPEPGRPQTILVTGYSPLEAVANVAVGLARALALLGRNVVLLDADLTRCAAVRITGCATAASGVLEVLRGTVPLSRAVARDRDSAVVVIGPAQPAAKVTADWNSGATRALFQHLGAASEFVVIHAPAHLDTVPLVSIAGAVLFVGAVGDETSLERAATAFAPAARHLGLVLAG